jgi:hypothetical protein
MKSGFKDPIQIKNQKPKDSPKDGKNTPWDYRAPQYDQRSSCFVGAGTHYGVGHAQPVGHAGKCKPYGVPKGRVNTMKVDEKG